MSCCSFLWLLILPPDSRGGRPVRLPLGRGKEGTEGITHTSSGPGDMLQLCLLCGAGIIACLHGWSKWVKPLGLLNWHKYFSPKLTFLSTFFLRELRQEGARQAHGSWFRLSFVYNHYLFFACILVVLLAIILYLLRLRRIHHRQSRASTPLDLLWIEEVVPMIGVQVGP